MSNPDKFENRYYKRTAGTPRPCFVCRALTPIVLATKDSVDFIYTCEGHLSDPGFASPAIVTGVRKLGVSDDEIQKVKDEWEERQRRKSEKEKEDKDQAKEENTGKNIAEEEKKKDKKDTSEKNIAEEEKMKDKRLTETTSSLTPPPVESPSHPQYLLQREFFEMRQRLHRKKRQAAQAREIAPLLPSAPRNSMRDGFK